MREDEKCEITAILLAGIIVLVFVMAVAEIIYYLTISDELVGF